MSRTHARVSRGQVAPFCAHPAGVRVQDLDGREHGFAAGDEPSCGGNRKISPYSRPPGRTLTRPTPPPPPRPSPHTHSSPLYASCTKAFSPFASTYSDSLAAFLANLASKACRLATMRAMSEVSVKGRIALSTKTLEAEPGDMIKDREKVFANAEATAAKYQERLEAERKAREEAAQDVIFGLESVFTEPGCDGRTALGKYCSLRWAKSAIAQVIAYPAPRGLMTAVSAEATVVAALHMKREVCTRMRGERSVRAAVGRICTRALITCCGSCAPANPDATPCWRPQPGRKFRNAGASI